MALGGLRERFLGILVEAVAGAGAVLAGLRGLALRQCVS